MRAKRGVGGDRAHAAVVGASGSTPAPRSCRSLGARVTSSRHRLRLATDADDAAVGALLVAAFEQTYARRMPEVVMSDRRRADLRAVKEKREVARVWVAEDESGPVVGTVAVWPPGAPGTVAGGVRWRRSRVASAPGQVTL